MTASLHMLSIFQQICTQCPGDLLGANRPEFSSMHSYRQQVFHTCKTFPKESTTCIRFIQRHKVCNSATVLKMVHTLGLDVTVCWTSKDKVLCVAGRNKWHMATAFGDNAPAAIPLSPEAVETARRAYSAGDPSSVGMPTIPIG